jgi:hypothetical protein
MDPNVFGRRRNAVKGRTAVTVLVTVSLVVLLVPARVAQAASPKMPAAASRGFPFGEPAYDSGWVDIAAGANLLLFHNLGGSADDYVVDLQGRSSTGDRHAYYGGDQLDASTVRGFYWYGLNITTITVHRGLSELYSEQVRVRIWMVPSAHYDSGWATLGAGIYTREHDLGGDPDDYIVYLEMFAPGYGVNHIGYGLDLWSESSGDLNARGTQWRELTSEHIRVYLTGEVGDATTVRVRIWRAPAPDYDSGWVDMSQGSSTTLAHNLGGPWNDYLVDLQFTDTDGTAGVNQRGYGYDAYYLGGSWYYQGGFWRSLNSSEVTLFRASDDDFADQMRVRIWASSQPKYDSGWQPVDRGATQTLTHDLGGDPDTYVVDLQFKDTLADGLVGHGVNRQYYGGDHPSSDTTFGAYWRNVTHEEITLFRLGDDPRADEMRARIWVAPFTDYESGWISTAQGACAALTHSAGVGAVVLDFGDANGYFGPHQIRYGIDRYLGSSGGLIEDGAYWKELTVNGITVCRGADDLEAERQRVRIWQRPEPDYDSGWVAIGAGSTQVLNHHLGLDPDGMVVEMLSSGTDVNQANYGSDVFSLGGSTMYEVGAYWRNLTSNSVTVVRGATDGDSSSVRVRIYLDRVRRVYLPIVLADL